jgi:hypothetical protein
MKAFLTLWFACLGTTLAVAQSVETSANPTQAPSPELRVRTAEELEKLVASIALYPDALVALILPASTSPSDVVLAARFVTANGNETNFDAQDWEDSIKGLARYPTVLKWMDENLEWTRSLGEAFVEQPADVMNAIQRLRAQAKARGLLTDTPQQKIVVEEDEICIVPARREVIYVPVYDPGIFWVRRDYPHHRSWLSFSSGFAVGVWLNYDCDWRGRHVWVHHRHPGWAYRPDWRHEHRRTHAVPRGETWRPDPRRIHHTHRYLDRASVTLRSGGMGDHDERRHDARYEHRSTSRREGSTDYQRDRTGERRHSPWNSRDAGGRRNGLAAPAPSISAPLVPPASNVAAATGRTTEPPRSAQPRVNRSSVNTDTPSPSDRIRHDRFRGDRSGRRLNDADTPAVSGPPVREPTNSPAPHKARSYDRERPMSSTPDRVHVSPERSERPARSLDESSRSSAGEAPRSSRHEERQESSRPAREGPRGDSVMRGSRY